MKFIVILAKNIFYQSPNDHINKQNGCIKCGFKSMIRIRRLSVEKFIERAIKVHGNKYDYKEIDYKNNRLPIKIYCNSCKEYFYQSPSNHLSNHGCFNCGGSKRLTKNEFIKKAIKVHGNKYNYDKVEYKNNSIKVEIYCNEHKKYFKQIPNSHLNGSRCPDCGRDSFIKSRLLTKEEFIRRAKEIHGEKYNYNKISYKNLQIKINIYCEEHNKYFKQTPCSHLNGSGCPECGLNSRIENRRFTKDKFIEKAKEVHGNKYNYDSVDYKDSITFIKIYCKKHKKYFYQAPAQHLQGNGCPICAESKGEKRISLLLDSLNIKYEREKRFDDCKNKRTLPFDFYLFNYNLCIEYDGRQHFELVSFGSNYEKAYRNFERLKYNDNIKNEYCRKNNIKLVRIKYSDNISEKLDFLK